MPLNLPEPDVARLAKSPLQLVVFQVRFEDVPSVADPRIALAVHKNLGDRTGRFPLLEPLRGSQVEVKVGIGGSPISAEQSPLSGWRFLSQGRDWTVSLLPGSVALETTAYTTWDADFGPLLTQCLDAVNAEVRPVLEQRVGLRYVDLIAEPEVTKPEGWRGLIVDELLGPILHQRLGPATISTQQQVEIDAGEGVRCTLRHGALGDPDRPGSTRYLLDWDIYRDKVRPFDLDDIKATLLGFNRLAVQLFQQALTPELLRLLKGDADA